MRREYSTLELQRRLRERDYEPGIIDATLAVLCEEGLQSDERFTEAYIYHRSQRGYGPIRIRQELRSRGIADEMINQWLSGPDWWELAESVYQKKYAQTPCLDWKERARRERFLNYRGFLQDHYAHLMECSGR